MWRTTTHKSSVKAQLTVTSNTYPLRLHLNASELASVNDLADELQAESLQQGT